MSDLPVVGVVRETAAGEERVALDPEVTAKLVASGFDVLVEPGAGRATWFRDQDYASSGARLVARGELLERAQVVLCHQPVPSGELHRGQVLVGMLQPLVDPAAASAYADAGVDTVSLDGLPRTLSAAQSMDALSSQANVAGYKAAVLAADTFGSYFPMLMTAAGTVRPARVLVLGGGVAGLQAIGTAGRLGAVVSGYDVRPEARADIESVGARFVELATDVSAAGEGGYARQLTAEETAAQQAALAAVVAEHDVVIATAAVPGRRPPLLVTEEALAAMRPGSVVVDLAAGPLGGNAAGVRPHETVTTDNGVTIIGATNLAARLPRAASAAYARNLEALLRHLTADGSLRLGAGDTDGPDPIRAGVVVTAGGRVVHPAVRALIEASEGVDTREPDPVL
jgi:NAD(P) transhydrogenase subunit alpha